MSELPDPTIEAFYHYCTERKLMAVRCVRCKHVMVPPRSICPNCRSIQVEWVQLSPRGKLVTYTVVHVAPPQFKHMTPYDVGIVEMQECVKEPCIFRISMLEFIKIEREYGVDVNPFT